MKTCLSLAILFLMISFSSCNKDSSNSQFPDNSVVSLVKTVQVRDSTGFVLLYNTHYYDENKRLTRITRTQYSHYTDSTVLECIYTYYPGMVVLDIVHDDSLYNFVKEVYKLNSLGLVDSTFHYYCATPNDSILDYIKICEYNADGYPIKGSWIPSSGAPSSWTFVYSNSNIVASYGPNNPLDSLIIKFTYDVTHSNSLKNSNFGLGFFGQSSKNPTISSTIFESATFSYEYDTDNRISQIRMHGYESIQSPIYWIVVPLETKNEILTYTYY